MTWEETKREFCRIAAKQGVVKTADKVPVHFSTIYRLQKGETQKPCRAIRESIERFVEQEHQRERDEQ